MNDSKWMDKAIELAQKGRGRVSPNPLVGCLVTKQGRVIASGYHKACGGPHAEAEALEGLKHSDCKGAEIFITLEPCCHQGKTGPCTELIANYPFKRIVIGTKDPNPKVSGKGTAFLKDKGFNVTTGVLKDKALQMNEKYNKHITSGKPFVTLKAAISLDGRIATSTGDSKWITRRESREDAHALRFEHDAVMVGAGTVAKDNPRLDCRLFNDDKVPARVIVDPEGSIPGDSYILKTAAKFKTFVAVKKSLGPEAKERLNASGAKLIELDDEAGVFDLERLLDNLASEGIASVLMEGGSHLLGSALEQSVADKLHLYVAPVVLGATGLPVFKTDGIKKVSEAFAFDITQTDRTGSDIKLTAYPRR